MDRSRERKIALRLVALAILLMIFVGVASAGKDIIFIKSPGCQKCAAAERVLNGIMAEDKGLKLEKYDYFSDEGHRIIKEYRVKDVPSVIVGQRVIGYREYETDDAKLEQLIREALANQSPNSGVNPYLTMTLPANQSSNLSNSDQSSSHQSGISKSDTGNGLELNLQEISLYTVSAVLGAGLLAGFNPCLLGILVFLAVAVLSSSRRKREMVTMVAFFSLGIFTMYFLFGLGMEHLLQAEAVADAFRYVLTAFLVIIGLAQILDAVRLDRGGKSLFRTDWALKYFQSGVERGSLSSYFLVGALFSLVKAPCVGAVYLAILDMISARNYTEGAIYLAAFNLGVVLPILILGGFLAFGMSPAQVDAFRKDHRVGMRLVTGLTLLALAPLIYWQLI
ncbi:MAG TPA: cytochrome c biogenesis protein [Methanothrix sp.]|nr:cytochrome c biogenesis protein [Methanothrix sp.]